MQGEGVVVCKALCCSVDLACAFVCFLCNGVDGVVSL